MNRCIIYTLYLIAILGYIVGMQQFDIYVKNELNTTLNVNIINHLINIIILPLIFGFLLGSLSLYERFISKRKKWKVNYKKLMIVGLPCLVICMTPLIAYAGSFFYTGNMVQKIIYLVYSNIDLKLLTVFLGFILLNSIEEKDK
ncbi:hypothetical protein [Desulfofalx alkaliphila]|uniref:hypothetical protein n=1 Tax=Desulfofalx alkaliphila TaxID=105483 RepID=UPI0004E2470C|nr:hypothetical protein [Desulfofalx alkaliphila]